MRIQHNVMAMNAYRNYSNNTSALSKNLERLSSGYKINRAGDDAAGLAISEKMRAQITGLEAAQKNVKDGISLVNTAEGAMQEIQDMLNRMVYLATQSSNGTYDNEVDRANLQKEVESLKTEIDRIADSANFNGIKLLDGSVQSKTATTGEKDLYKLGTTGGFKILRDGQLGKTPQAGTFELDLTNFTGNVADDNTDVTIKVFGEEITVGTYNKGDQVTGEEIAKAIAEKFDITGASGDVDFNDTYDIDLTATQNGEKVIFTMNKPPVAKWDTSSAVEITGLDNNNKETGSGNQAHGLQVKTLTEPVDNTSGRLYAQAEIDLSKLTIVDGSTLTIGDTTYVFAVGKNSAFKDAENMIDLTDLADSADVKKNLGKVTSRITTAAQDNKNFKVTAQSPVGASTDKKIYLTELEGGVDTENYKLEGKINDADATGANGKDGDWTGLLKFGKADAANSTTGLTLQIGDTSDKFNQLRVSVGDMHVKALGISDINIGTQAGAAAAINRIKAAINQVSSVRGDLGAISNRLDHTANNLSVMRENITDAESAIRDTDIAEEMMSYTKNNILVQSAQAMLAQANQVPQGVLQLLQ